MIKSNLYQKTQYTWNRAYSHKNIVEYDISKANINILLYFKMISKNDYDRYLAMTNEQRKISIGCLMKLDPNVRECLEQGFVEMRRLFFDANNISDEEVVSIKKDAIFLTRKANVTNFGNVEFKEKNRYNAFYKLCGKEIYYNHDLVTDKRYIDIKGISDDKVVLHQGFLSLIIKVMDDHINNGNKSASKIVQAIYTDYINKRLPIECYRQFDAQSKYGIKTLGSSVMAFTADILPQNIDIKYIDITYNATVLQQLFIMLNFR